MNLLTRAADFIERGALGLFEFTACLRIDPAKGGELIRELERLDDLSPSPFEGVTGVHSARFLMLDGSESLGTGVMALPTGPLVFSLVHEGLQGDVLTSLLAAAGAELRAVLRCCNDYPRSADDAATIGFLKRARVESSYLFSETGSHAGEPVHSTIQEIRSALHVRRAFLRFVCDRQKLPSSSDRELRTAFRKLASQNAGPSDEPLLGYPFRLRYPFEEPIDDELYWMRRLAELTARATERSGPARAPGLGAPRRRRDVHAKHHALLDAELIVNDDIAERFQHGVFKPGAHYRALVRSSNGSGKVQPDAKRDARGLAIKLLDVADRGAPLLDGSNDDLNLDNEANTQDFVLISHPTFFAKDARDFAILRSIVDGLGPNVNALRLAMFLLRRPMEAAIFASTILQRAEHPLALTYHSGTAYLLGPEQVVKYSLRPKLGPGAFSGQRLDRSDPDCMRAALRETLDQARSPVDLELSIHVPEGKQLPVEDSRVNWDRRGAQRVPIATLRIRSQNFDRDDRHAQAERISFTPWHCLQAHQPLGSINRARWVAYRAGVSARRAVRAGEPGQESSQCPKIALPA